MEYRWVLLIVVLWVIWNSVSMLRRKAARKPTQPKKAFLTKLLDSKPLDDAVSEIGKTGNTQPPEWVSDENKLFCADFAAFAAVVNWWFGDEHVNTAWRLKELPDMGLRLDYAESPTYGRRFDVFHNQVQLGTLELSAAYGYTSKEPKVWTSVALNNVRLLPFDTIRDFLTGVALHVSNTDLNSPEYLRVSQEINQAMMRALWYSTMLISKYGMDGEDWGEIELRFEGTPSWYVVRREGLRRLQGGAWRAG
jgi:hypothetical protein